jgi:hypothetical protein
MTSSTVVGYNGDFATNGGEIGIGDGFVVQFEGYATAPYVAVSCPTVFCVEEEADRQALAADAATAFESGKFPRFLVTPLVTVLDQQFWQRSGRSEASSTRLYVSGDPVELRSGPAGGTVSTESFSSPDPVAGQDNASLLRDNPGVGRFLGAAKSLRGAQGRFATGVEVAGFGCSLVESDDRRALEQSRTDSVFVLISGHQYFVTDVQSGKLNKVPRDVARAVETILSGAMLGPELQARLGLSLRPDAASAEEQVNSSAELRKLFARLGIAEHAHSAAVPPPVAVAVNPALTIVPVVIT